MDSPYQGVHMSIQKSPLCQTCNVSEAAEVLGCGSAAVRRLIRQGHLQTLPVGRKVRITIRSIDALLGGQGAGH